MRSLPAETPSTVAVVERSWPSDTALIAVVVLIMSAIAVLISPAYTTDRDVYERIGRELVLPDCSSLHCTRVLVAWVIEHLPGLSLVKWKLYAILGNIVAAVAVARLCLWFGLARKSARVSVALVALGGGSQLTLADPHTSDPFMYALLPVMILMLLNGRFAGAGTLGTVGVLAKEVAAAPLWIFALYGALVRRRGIVSRSVLAASIASTAWLLMQLWFILRHNYSFAGHPGSQILSGGYIVKWLQELGFLHAAGTLVLRFGPLFLLAAIGLRRAPKQLTHLVLAAVPVALLLCYVQQPDRALWNFQFLFIPLAVMLFDGIPTQYICAFVLSYGMSNLRPGTPAFDWIPIPAFVVSVTSVALIVRTARSNQGAAVEDEQSRIRPLTAGNALVGRERIIRLGMIASLLVLTAALLVALDIAVHRRLEAKSGVNIWGYRGHVLKQKGLNEIRIVMVGGSRLFDREWEGSIALYLQDYLNNERLQRDAHYVARGAMTVVNLGGPYDGVPTFRQTLEDYEYLRYDVVCLYIGREDPAPTPSARKVGWRRQSAVFRATGYLPILSQALRLETPSFSSPASEETIVRSDAEAPFQESWNKYAAALVEAVDHEIRRGRKVIVATQPLVFGGEEDRRQDAVSALLRQRFGGRPGFSYVDLRRTVDLHHAGVVEGDDQTRRHANSLIAESLSQAVFRLLNQP